MSENGQTHFKTHAAFAADLRQRRLSYHTRFPWKAGFMVTTRT